MKMHLILFNNMSLPYPHLP